MIFTRHIDSISSYSLPFIRLMSIVKLVFAILYFHSTSEQRHCPRGPHVFTVVFMLIFHRVKLQA